MNQRAKRYVKARNIKNNNLPERLVAKPLSRANAHTFIEAYNIVQRKHQQFRRGFLKLRDLQNSK